MTNDKASVIERKYNELLLAGVDLGVATSDLMRIPTTQIDYRHYEFGSIFWHPETGAHEVRGAIRQKWAGLGWGYCFLGYPITGETTCADGVGNFNHFQGGSIFWYPETGAHEVHGAICDFWAVLGWERSYPGYPVSDEMPGPPLDRYNKFQYGYIAWSPETGACYI